MSLLIEENDDNFQCNNCKVNDVLQNSTATVGMKPGVTVFFFPYLPLINLITGLHTGDCLGFSGWDFEKTEHCKSNQSLSPEYHYQ